MKTAIALPAVLVLAGCSTAPPHPAADALISLEKGGCGYMAACPAYTISVNPAGGYRYEGFRNVAVLGVREGQLPVGGWDRAEAAFTGAGWTVLADPTAREGGYPCMPDAPFARITRKTGADDAKVFTYNLGCDSKPGSALLDALTQIFPIPDR